MISHPPLFATLAALKTGDLFGLSVKLLNLPTSRRILSEVVGHDIFRALGGAHKLHSMTFGEILQVDGFPMGLLGFTPVELVNSLVWVFAIRIVNTTVAL